MLPFLSPALLHKPNALTVKAFISTTASLSQPQVRTRRSRGGTTDTRVAGPSRTRLSQDLKPGATSKTGGSLRASLPRQPRLQFTRDSLPHEGVNPMTRDQSHSSFRRRREGTEVDKPRSRRDDGQRQRGGRLRSDDERAPRGGSYHDQRDRPSGTFAKSGSERSRERPFKHSERATRHADPSSASGGHIDRDPVEFRDKDALGRPTYKKTPSQHDDQRYSSSSHRSERPSSPSNSRTHDSSRERKSSNERRASGSGGRDARAQSHTKPADDFTEFFDPLSIPEQPTPPHQSGTGTEISSNELPTSFTSPPLMPGLLTSVHDVLGPSAIPTPIQALSLKWLFDESAQGAEVAERKWKQFLLASETGSGKSIAYLLPMLQALKQAELAGSASSTPPVQLKHAMNPRALVLAPTHELARQLSAFAKALLHVIKLRVVCVSRANVSSMSKRKGTASKMAEQFAAEMGVGEFDVLKGGKAKPADVVVGTPMKLLEMIRGRGWDRIGEQADENDGVDVEPAVEADSGEKPKRVRRGVEVDADRRTGTSRAEMGLSNVEWVIVDEADVLFDPDFQATTRMLLADISKARGEAITLSQEPILSSTPTTPTTSDTALAIEDTKPLAYPFNLILTSATIPTSLAAYLDKHHPTLIRLASPNLHHLPKTLQTEYVNWTGGNKYADIERRIRRVWAEDSAFGGVAAGRGFAEPAASPRLSKVLIFANKSSKVVELGEYLNEKNIKNVALTSTSDSRKRGSNHHLDGFLRTVGDEQEPAPTTSDPAKEAHVMITTSLLSRGLDFSPSIRHVFIVDEPRNMIDFIHRAGRSGRAGERGKVVVFGKMKGRGSAKAKNVRKRVGALVA